MENQENLRNYSNTDHKISLNKGSNYDYSNSNQYDNNVEITNLDPDIADKVEEIGYGTYIYEDGNVKTHLNEEVEFTQYAKNLPCDNQNLAIYEYDQQCNNYDEITDNYGNYLDNQTQGNFFPVSNIFSQVFSNSDLYSNNTYNQNNFTPFNQNQLN